MKKKIIISTLITLVVIVAGGSAFLYTRMTTPEDEKEISPVTAQGAEKQAEAEKTPDNKDVSGSDSAEKDAKISEEEKEEADRKKKEKEKAKKKAKEMSQALENLDKERKATLEFLGQYDKEAMEKKERSEAISRWLEKKPN